MTSINSSELTSLIRNDKKQILSFKPLVKHKFYWFFVGVFALALSVVTILISHQFQSTSSDLFNKKNEAKTFGEDSKIVPHIIFVLIDDMGWNDIGYNSIDLEGFSPTIDGLAKSGIILDQYYSQSVCTPSRAALLTGMYPIHNGMQHGMISESEVWGLSPSYSILPSYLKQAASYRSVIIGKWHLGHYYPELTPPERGFDHFYGFYTGYVDYITGISEPLECQSPFCYRDFRRNEKPIDFNQTHLLYALADEVDQNLWYHSTEIQDLPLFLYYAIPSVHMPLDIPDEILEKYDDQLSSIGNDRRRLFAALVIMTDLMIERLINTLRDTGMYENSLIILASDNGAMPDTEAAGSNYPLRGFKKTLFEGGHKVPAFLHSPLFSSDLWGTKNSQIFHVTDWLPTLMDGVLNKGDQLSPEIDGVNQWDNILHPENNFSPRKDILYNIDNLNQTGYYQGFASGAIRAGKWKLIVNEQNYPVIAIPGPEDVIPSVNELLEEAGDYGIYLFDLDVDPIESNNLKDEYPEIVQDLFDIFRKYHDSMIPSAFCDYDDVQRFNVFEKTGFISPWRENEFKCPSK